MNYLPNWIAIHWIVADHAVTAAVHEGYIGSLCYCDVITKALDLSPVISGADPTLMMSHNQDITRNSGHAMSQSPT